MTQSIPPLNEAKQNKMLNQFMLVRLSLFCRQFKKIDSKLTILSVTSEKILGTQKMFFTKNAELILGSKNDDLMITSLN